jgi:hypothetical protein
MPVAPVAGFNPTQQQAFGEVGAAQGMAQPYFNTGAGYTAQSAAPVTAADVSNVYNPMASNVTAQLQNIFGEQNVQNQGNLTAQAGGVGADRIAVGMGDLANQQGLAAGQTYSNLYQQALQTAMQEKQLQAGAGGQFAAFGTGAQNAALQGAGALGSAGLQQQQQTQAQLNAPYQNTLAQIAYQFQTPQYLAGIAGGLAPALGGTTTGQQQVTAPSPTLLSQLLGIGTAGAGIYGALGGSNPFGGNPSYGGGSAVSGDAYGGSAASPLPGLTDQDYGIGYAKGGEVEGYDDGGQTQQNQDQGLPFPGASIPKVGGAEPIPYTSLPMGAGHSGPLVGGINFPNTQNQTTNPANNIGSEVASAIKIASMFANRGGAVPHYDDGGYTPNLPGPDADPSRPIEGSPSEGFFSQAPWPFNTTHTEMGGHGEMVPYPTNDNGNQPDFSSRFRAAFPNAAAAATRPPVPQTQPFSPEVPYRLDPTATAKWRKKTDEDAEDTTPVNATPASYGTPSGTNPYVSPQSGLPYPNATSRDWGQNIAASPWMALIKAGAAMAQTTGPIGVSIAKGIQAGAGALDTQRKELRSEQELNDKAAKLYQDAQVHLDKYNKMTPYEQGSLAARNREIDQSGDGGTAVPKEIDIQRISKALSESPQSPYFMKDPVQIRQVAIDMWRSLHGGGQSAAAPTIGATPAGTTKEFDDGKGGKVMGVWDGTKWVPQ